MATSPHVATAPRITSTRVAPRILATLAVAGVIAGGIVVSSNSSTDHAGPVTGGRTVAAHRADISARHPVVASNGRAAVRVVK
jgi:hypothetical protein